MLKFSLLVSLLFVLVFRVEAAQEVKSFAPVAIDKVDVYSVEPSKSVLRVIRMSTAASSELGVFNTYPIFVFELIKIPQQRVLKQIRIQKAIKLKDGKTLPIKDDEVMDVIPDRHEFDGEKLRVWINYYPPRPPGLLVECRYKVSSKDIQPQGCDASAVE